MTDLETYVRYFMNLRRAPGRVWGEATHHLAPHKPLLLLSVLDMAERGSLTSSIIYIDKNLYELNELFTNYWRQIIPLSQKSSIAFPFSRLRNEPFWNLIPFDGNKITSEAVNNITSVSELEKWANAAQLDEPLYELMMDKFSRSTLRNALLEAHFSPKASQALQKQAVMNGLAWGYAEKLAEMAHEPLVEKVLQEREVAQPIRDAGFKTAVVRAYDHRCALCGVRILTTEGHTCVDAAHIEPWSESHNDDIRNGMALCKLCHWAFDNAMAAVGQKYEVMISNQVQQAPNTAGSLLALQGRGLIGPEDQKIWPYLPYLANHRKGFAG